MTRQFEELDYRATPLGELVLQRRKVLSLDGAVAYEVKLNGDYLMSSLFHVAEAELARLALDRLHGSGWDVVVGGLGLGYTAAAVLAFHQVEHVRVVEMLEPVVDWHRRGWVPNGAQLTADPRCQYQVGDFFALAREGGFDPDRPGRPWDAVLLDIDHSPTHHLAAAHADFYSEAGLQRLRGFLKPGGVFALWSNDDPDEQFLNRLRRVFGQAEGHRVEFDNPLQGNKTANGVYVAQRPLDAGN